MKDVNSNFGGFKMKTVYVVVGTKIREYPLIKETKLSFIVEHSGGAKGRYTQPKLRRDVGFYGYYVDEISTLDLQEAKLHAKETYERIVGAHATVVKKLNTDLKEYL